MKKNKKNKKGATKLEKFLCKSFLMLTVMLTLGILVTSAAASKLNVELQNMNKKVDSQKDTNESLAMIINEMASLENVQGATKGLGLKYNNENIKTID